MAGRKLFGTDGIRGEANSPPLTADLALTLGKTLALLLARKDSRPRIVIGKDTRLSGYMLETAIVSGICAGGGEALLLGPLPTPGVAFITKDLRAGAGVVISASHNPYQDNGIKIFDGDGLKLPDELEKAIESYLTGENPFPPLPMGAGLGRASRINDAAIRYAGFVKRTFPENLSLESIRMVVDCANGAAYQVAPQIFRNLGAEVTAINDRPDGLNINRECGALYPGGLQKKVVEVGADLGVALDGDGDRAILVDHRGALVDGDQIMAICATRMKEEGILSRETVVATVMTNQALKNYFDRIGVAMIRTGVGDRYVSEVMREKGYVLGGEQSGHIIFGRFSATGDGLITALQVLRAMVASGKNLQDLASVVVPYPQILINVPVKRKKRLESISGLENEIDSWESRLGEGGRVLIRFSGTEPVLRIMVEGRDEMVVGQAARSLADYVVAKEGK